MASEYAFNGNLIAYEIGRPNRTKELVIQVHSKFNGKDAKNTLEKLQTDETDAGSAWSPQELALQDLELTQVAMVVGEYVVDADESWKKLLQSHKKKTPKNTVLGFREETHAIIRRGEVKTAILVARLATGEDMSFFALGNKGPDGLCDIWLLGSASDATVTARQFFYPEWTSGTSPITKRRILMWKQNIKNAIREWPLIKGADILNVVNRASDKYRSTKLATVADPLKVAYCEVMRLFALYKTTGDDGHLSQIARTLSAIIGRENKLTDQDLSYEALWVRFLVCGSGDISQEEADIVASACNSIWFDESPSFGSIPKTVTGENLFALAQGLRAGALGGSYIDERLHRTFIVLFCRDYSRATKNTLQPFGPTAANYKERLSLIIKLTYETVLSAAGTSTRPPGTAVTNLRLQGSELIMLVAATKLQVDEIRAAGARYLHGLRTQMPGDLAGAPTDAGMKKSAQALSNAGEVNEARLAAATYLKDVDLLNRGVSEEMLDMLDALSASFGQIQEALLSGKVDFGGEDEQGGSGSNAQGGSGNNEQGGSGNNEQGGSGSKEQGGKTDQDTEMAGP